jgi:hypothetical protein
MPSAGYEPALPAIKRPQAYALDRTAKKHPSKILKLNTADFVDT